MSGRQVDIQLADPPGQTIARIQAATGQDGWLAGWSRKGEMLSRIRGSRLRLRMRHHKRPFFGHSYYRNSHAPFFFGSVQASNGGTRLLGRIDMHPSARWFERLWAAGVTLALIFGGVVPLATGHVNANHIGLVIIPPLMLVGLFVMRIYGKWLGEGDREELIQFLDGLTHAEATED